MSKVKRWLDTNLLTLNKDKTVYITFSPRENTQPLGHTLKIHEMSCKLTTQNVCCDCHAITKLNSTKYLGLIMDQHLKWDIHINSIVKKLRCVLLKFYTLRNILSQKLLKNVFYALAQSLIQYGISGWGGTYDVHLKSLKTIQNSILKVILKKPCLTSTLFLSKNLDI